MLAIASAVSTNQVVTEVISSIRGETINCRLRNLRLHLLPLPLATLRAGAALAGEQPFSFFVGKALEFAE